MNKLSKLTALLLAIVLALGVPMQVMAESAENTVKDVIDTLTEYLQVADTALYEKIMSFTTYAEYAEVEQYLADEHVVTYITQNDATRVSKIQDHLSDLFWAASASYAGYVGPILYTIDVSTSLVSGFSLLSRDGEIGTIAEEATSGFSDHDGLELKKSATKKDAETYTISLEAYAEGTVKTTTISTPVDVVVVMDLSSSMTSDFNGQQRIAALKTAVRNFIATYDDDGALIGGVASTYSSDADHRIALVGYSSAVRVDTGWVEANTAGVTSLRNTVAGMSTAQGTHTDYGMERAVKLLDPDEDYSYTGVNTNRQKVVVLFTDGVPSTSGSNDFTPTYAEDAINAAYTLKNDENIKATVWSVAVVSGADPEATLSSNTAASGGNATTNAPKINLMMHAISSNYPKATATATNDLLTVTLDTGSNQGYYLSATTPDELNDIFSDIADTVNTGSSNVTLDSTTVLKDVMTPYFDLPDEASSIKVYTVDCVGFNTDGTPIWDTTDGVENKVVYSATVKFGTTDSAGNTTNITDAPTETSNTVWVENFDYSANYVANVDHDDPLDRKDPVDSGTEFYGRKLVIEFDVTPTDGFLGGNDVVTNEVTSGIYEKTEDGYDPFEDFEVPDVDVDLWNIQVIGKHQHIFLSNEADMNALLQSFSLQYTKEGSPNETYTVDGIRNDYATLVFTLTKTASGHAMVYTIEPGATVGTWTYVNTETGDPIENFDVTPFLTDDTTAYTISYNVIPIPKEDGTGVAATNGELTVGVHVYKPTFTFQDTTEKYLSEVTAENYYNNNNYVSESWSHTYKDDDLVTVEITDPLTVTINVENNGTMSYTVVNSSGEDWGTGANWTVNSPIVITPPGETRTFSIYMTGTKPTVAFTYSPVETEWIQGGKVTAVECVPVDVTKVTLTSTNTHDKVEQGEGGVVTEGEYQTRSVYTEGSDSASVTITKLEEGATSTPTSKTVTDIPHIKTLRNELDCNCSYDAQEGGVTDIHANAPETGAVPEFVIHITDVSGDLRIGKRVEPDSADADATFAFTLTLKDKDGNLLPDGTYDYVKETLTNSTTDTAGNVVETYTQVSTGTITVDDGICTFTLKDTEHLVIKDLPAETTFTVKETPVTGYTTFVSIDDAVPETGGKTTTWTDVIEGGKERKIRFINVLYEGTLNVVKKVVGASAPAGEKFDFTIILKDKDGNDLSGQYPYTVTTYGENGQAITSTSVTTGIIEVQLGNLESVLISNLPTDALFAVTETLKDGYVTTAKQYLNETEVDTASTLILDTTEHTENGSIGTANMVTFFNTYQYAPLTIKKIVTGNAASADDTFLFTVTGTGITDKMQVILKAGETVTINDLPLGTYTVTEETAWSWRYELDSVTCGGTSVENGASQTLDPSGLSYVFTNSVDNQQWLDGNAHADNNFTGTTTTTTEGDGN